MPGENTTHGTVKADLIEIFALMGSIIMCNGEGMGSSKW